MISFKKREHYLVLGTLICLGALAFDHLAIAPAMNAWNTRAQRIAELERLIGHGTMLVAREQEIAERWRQMRERSRPLENSAIENELLNGVNRWARTSELAVTSLNPNWLTDEENCRKLEIQLSANGKLSSIVRFLYELGVDPQALKVEDMDLSARDNQGQMLTCDLRFTRLIIEEGKQ